MSFRYRSVVRRVESSGPGVHHTPNWASGGISSAPGWRGRHVGPGGLQIVPPHQSPQSLPSVTPRERGYGGVVCKRAGPLTYRKSPSSGWCDPRGAGDWQRHRASRSSCGRHSPNPKRGLSTRRDMSGSMKCQEPARRLTVGRKMWGSEPPFIEVHVMSFKIKLLRVLAINSAKSP
jgi:hypothetical protein